MTYEVPLPIPDARDNIEIESRAFLRVNKIDLDRVSRPRICSNFMIKFVDILSLDCDIVDNCPLSSAKGVQLIGAIKYRQQEYTYSNLLLQSRNFIVEILQILETTKACGIWIAVDSKQNPFFEVMNFLMKEGSYAHELDADACDMVNNESSIFFSDKRHFEYLNTRLSSQSGLFVA